MVAAPHTSGDYCGGREQLLKASTAKAMATRAAQKRYLGNFAAGLTNAGRAVGLGEFAEEG